jgi:hypothetical protein
MAFGHVCVGVGVVGVAFAVSSKRAYYTPVTIGSATEILH